MDACIAEQICVNIEGSHMCICSPGYSGPTCIGGYALQFSDMKMYGQLMYIHECSAFLFQQILMNVQLD